MLESIISEFIEQQFPQIYREEGPFFIQFLTEYYKWLETDPTSPIYNSRTYLSNHDIDTTVDDFVIYYKEKYLKNIQINTATNTKQLIKNSSDLYRSKGTENAIKLFFDLIFSADSSVYYPGTDVFRLSDAKWVVPRYLEITSSAVNRLLVGRAITGINSGATAFVENLVRKKINNNYIEIIYISAIQGDFQTGEIIRLVSSVNENYDNNPKIIGSLTQLDILDGGEGFSKGEVVNLTSRTGSEGKALVNSLATITGIVDFTLDDGGWGYTGNSSMYVSEKVLQLANVHVVSTANLSLADKIINVVQPMANVQWFNNTSIFSTGDVVYNYYANGSLIGVNTIISAEYGTNSTTNFFLLNTTSGLNYMDPTAPYYYKAGNTSNFQVQNAGWVDNTASGISDGMSSNVIVYCSGSSNSFILNDLAYQISSNNVVYANSTVKDIIPIGSNSFSLKINNLNGLFLTNQPLYSYSTNSNVSITSLSYDIGVRAVNGSFKVLNGNYIKDTGNTSLWNATISRIPFGAGANTNYDTNLLHPETISLNTNFVRDHIDELNSANWVNATSYGASLNSANLTNMFIANALMYVTKTLGMIGALTNENPGALYTYPPFVDPIDSLVAPLNLQDFVIRTSDTTGIFSVGEEVTQAISGADGLVKFANTTEVHIRRLSFEDKWTVGNANTSYLIIGTSSGHSAYPIEVTYDIDRPAGHNAIITTKISSSNSTVQDLIVTDSGFSFNNGDEVDFVSEDGLRVGAALAIVNKQGYGSGFYKDNSGFLSTNKYLYDGYYYQDLSYEIRSPITSERYSEMLKEVLHTAGTAIFAAIRKVINLIMGTGSKSNKSNNSSHSPPPLQPPVNTSLPIILGAQALNKTLTCDNGSWANSPSSYSYQWKNNGNVIVGATNQTYTVASGDVGNSITCTVTATNSAGSTSIDSPAVIPIPAPVNNIPPFVTGSATSGSIISTTNGNWNNSPTSYAYQWKRNASSITGEINNLYTLTDSDIGANVQVSVTATNLTGSASVLSNIVIPTGTTSSLLPINTSVPVTSGVPILGATLSCTTGAWLNNPTSYSYQWRRNGNDIAGATSNTYVTVNSDVGQILTCYVTATNGSGSSSALSIPIGTIVAPPTNTVLPSISGVLHPGNTLTCTNGTWTNSPDTYSYQWKRDGVVISGETNSTYIISSIDDGHTLSCSVTASNIAGNATATSSGVGPIIDIPVNTTAPLITGSAVQGSILSCTNGAWTNSPSSYSYQWKSNGTNITGATSNTYTTVSGDIGNTITCVVTATNSAGSASATSSNSIVVTSPSVSVAGLVGMNMAEDQWYTFQNLRKDLWAGDGIYCTANPALATTGDVVGGSSIITNLASTTNLIPGMVVTGGGLSAQGNIVRSISGNTVTLQGTAQSTSTGASLSFTIHGQTVPDAYCDSEGWPNAMPPGCTSFSTSIGTPITAQQYLFTWEGTMGSLFWTGTYSGAGTPGSNSVTINPNPLASSISGAHTILNWTVPGGGLYPKHFKIRPSSGDDGALFTSQSVSLLQNMTNTGGPIRYEHTGLPDNDGHMLNWPNTVYPVDGDTQLKDPIITATNRNTPKSSYFWQRRDMWPIEWRIAFCNATNRHLYLNMPWNADSTYYAKVADLIKNGDVANGWQPLNSNLNVYIETSNEVWNSGYTINSQCFNEANQRGTRTDSAVRPQVRLSAIGNVTLSGILPATAPAISSITFSNRIATVTTATAHGLSNNQEITVSGASPSDYNRTALISVINATSFTYVMATIPATNATTVGSYVQTLGGGVPANGDRVLLWAQTDKTQNGIWVVNSSGAWTRPADASGVGSIQLGDIWYISDGTPTSIGGWKNTSFYCPMTGTITPGTTQLTLSQVLQQHRYAEKAAQIFVAFETVFSPADFGNRVFRMLAGHAIDGGVYFPTMLDWPLSHGADKVDNHVDGFLTTVYYGPNDGPNALSTSGTGFTMTQVQTAMYGSIDSTIALALQCKAAAAARGKILHNYEGGCGIRFGNSTYQQSVMDDPGCYNPQAYWLNENRRALPGSFCCYHEFVGKVDTVHGSYGLVYEVTDTINNTQFSRAQALSDAKNGNYTLFDPTFVAGGVVYDNALSGTICSTFTKGLLPEATLSITGTGSSNFTAVMTTDSNGSKIAQIKTAVSNVTAGTYSLNLVQTYNNPVTGIQTKTTPFSATITVYVWTPDQAATSLWAWFTPSTTSCFTDSAGTVPVANDGDLVACVKDHTGTIILNQFNSAKPAYRLGGGKPYLDCVSTAFLYHTITTLTDGSGQHSGGAACYFTANVANAYVIGYGIGAGLGTPLYNNNGTSKVTAAASPANVSDNGPSVSLNTGVVLTELTSTTSTEVFVNGTGNGATNLSPNTLTFNTGTGPNVGGFTGRLYGFAMYKGVLSTSDHTKLVTYLSSLY
jgi:hypothetical protein